MVDRQEVEALLAACEPGSDAFVPAMDQMTRRKMRALCRAWLALQDAPVALMGMDCVLYGSPSPLIALSGQRVRIVPVEDVDDG